MLSYLTNEKIKHAYHFNNEGEILFLQKIKELLHNNSGVSYSYKIHNAYSILLELKLVIEDLYYGRTNGFVFEDVRKEAYEILEKDKVFSKNKPALYGTILEEIKRGFSIDKNNQSINESDMNRIYTIQNMITTFENTYNIMAYLNDTLDMLKQAICNNECELIIHLTECLVSSIIITKRSISSVYYMIGYYFEKSEKTFSDCWNLWISYLLRINEKFVCYFKVEDRYKDKVTNLITGDSIITQHPNAKGLEKINQEDTFFYVEIDVPAKDNFMLVEKAVQIYKKEMGIVEFATAKVGVLTNEMIVYNKHFDSFFNQQLEVGAASREYKPYNQYHKNIDRAVREFINILENKVDKSKLENAIINSCNFEGEGKTYNFLLMWSSLEALFRSNQYPTAISAIKDIVPNILTQRYVYYRLYDFLTDCKNIGITYQYQEKEVIVDVPNDEKINLLFKLLRDDSQKEDFLLKCKNTYELLYHRGKELEKILLNAQTVKQKIERHKQVLGYQLQRMYRIRNKFVHHSIVDEHVEVLNKHIRVYMWEAIREMSYVAVERKICTLEELYSYFRMNQLMMKKMLINANSPIEIKHITKGYL